MLTVNVANTCLFSLVLGDLHDLYLSLTNGGASLVVSTALFRHVINVTVGCHPTQINDFTRGVRRFRDLHSFLTSLALADLVSLPFALLVFLIVTVLNKRLI